MKETDSKKIDKLGSLIEAQGAKFDAKFDVQNAKLDIQGERLDTLTTRVDRLTTNVDRLTTNVDRLVMTVVGIKEYMHTELATKGEVRELRQEMLTNFDAQGVMLQRLDHEFVALRGNTERRLTRVEGHLGLSDT